MLIFFLKDTIKLLKFRLRGNIGLEAKMANYYPRKMGTWGSMNLEIDWGGEGKGAYEAVKPASCRKFPFWQQELSLLFGLPYPRLPTWLLASLPPSSLYSVLHSFSICCWLLTCCLGNPRIPCVELHGSGTFHNYLTWERQAAGWE